MACAGPLRQEAGEAGEEGHVLQELLHVGQVFEEGGQPRAGER